MELRKVHIGSSRSGTRWSTSGMWDPSYTSANSHLDSHLFPQDSIVPKASSTLSMQITNKISWQITNIFIVEFLFLFWKQLK